MGENEHCAGAERAQQPPIAGVVRGANRLAMAFVAVGFVLILLLTREPRRHDGATDAGRLPPARIWPFVVITLIAFSAYAIVQQVMAPRLQDTLGFAPEDSIARAGVGLLVTALAMVVVQGVVVRAISWRPERLLAAGAVIGAASTLLCGLARSDEETLVVLVAFGIALGLLLPGNLTCLSLRAGPRAKGKAAGINMMGQWLGLAAGPLAGATLHQLSPFAPFAAATVLLAVAASLAAWAARERERVAAPEAT